jgi:hypothetical protein
MQALKTKQGRHGPSNHRALPWAVSPMLHRAVANQWARSRIRCLPTLHLPKQQLLRKQGGMGTINPVTGLREYGVKKTFPHIFKGIGKAVKKSVVKGVVNVAKSDCQASPIGRIVATIALTAFLGPAGASIGGGFFGAAAAAGVAGTSIGLLAGESLKDSLISGATAYFGAPGGPVAELCWQGWTLPA